MWPHAKVAATDCYQGDVLSDQFAYDAVAGYRRHLRRLFLRVATAVLEDPPWACPPTTSPARPSGVEHRTRRRQRLSSKRPWRFLASGHQAAARELVADTA
jgi:hypothetical protein